MGLMNAHHVQMVTLVMEQLVKVCMIKTSLLTVGLFFEARQLES